MNAEETRLMRETAERFFKKGVFKAAAPLTETQINTVIARGNKAAYVQAKKRRLTKQ